MPSSALLLQGAVVGLLTGGVYALLASGLTLVFGIMRVVHISHAAFLVLAAYAVYLLDVTLGLDPLLAIPIVVPIFMLVGWAVQRVLIARLPADNFSMMSVLLTFAIAITIEGGLVAVATSGFRTVNAPYANSSLRLGDLRLPYDQLIGFTVALVTFATIAAVLKFSRYGQALRATVQHPQAAQLVGINIDRVKAVGFALSLATAAVGGAVLAMILPFQPSTHYEYIARLMAIIVVGGLGSIKGALYAGLLMGVLEGVVLVSIDATWGAMLFYIALFATLIFRPSGFFGGRLAERF
ncbi:MAG TPA: branched-chain amino acid ABC transporter permease [Euzebya sp.]|nr:branched-chain amino acid ABC transporter permease [Euzebya sp.]